MHPCQSMPLPGRGMLSCGRGKKEYRLGQRLPRAGLRNTGIKKKITLALAFSWDSKLAKEAQFTGGAHLLHANDPRFNAQHCWPTFASNALRNWEQKQAQGSHPTLWLTKGATRAPSGPHKAPRHRKRGQDQCDHVTVMSGLQERDRTASNEETKTRRDRE